MRILISLFLSISLFFSLSADPGKKNACKADIEKHCKDVEKGEGRVFECLNKKKSELSKPCKNFLGKLKQYNEQRVKDCKADVEKYCKDVEKGEGRIVSCLKENESKLSPKCKKHVKKAKAQSADKKGNKDSKPNKDKKDDKSKKNSDKDPDENSDIDD